MEVKEVSFCSAVTFETVYLVLCVPYPRVFPLILVPFGFMENIRHMGCKESTASRVNIFGAKMLVSPNAAGSKPKLFGRGKYT